MRSTVLLVVCLLGIGFLQYSEARRTLKLPHYDVSFGKWPLMEVTKIGRGSKGYAPPRPSKPRSIPFRSPFKGFRLGPPPPPGKFVLFGPDGSRGAIHNHLQETIKQYASGKKPVNTANLPIIVKAPGPHNPPPPPPGYALGPPRPSAWQQGPPGLGPSPFAGLPPVSPQSGKSTRLFSMLHNAAYSGMFNNAVDTYTSPLLNTGPITSGTFMNVYPDGTQVTTHVNNDFVPGPARLNDGQEAKPSVPPVITVGGLAPENYTVLFAQQQVVGIKSPETLELSGNANPDANEYDLEYNLGTKYEQGHGAKPPPTHPLVVTKFHKRGDFEPVKKLVTKDLPDSGVITTTSVVYQTPNISAPLGGRNSPLFQQGLVDKRREEKLRRKEKPLDAQVKLLGRLFTKLQRIKPPVIAVPEHELDDHHEAVKPSVTGIGWGWTDEEGDAWNKKAKTKVDSPVMAALIQTYTAPEVNSSDPDIVESMAEFGNHDVQFAETDELVNLMSKIMREGSSRINLRDLGSNPHEINDNMLNWVRRHLAITRVANSQSHVGVEKLASNQFKQFQTFVTPPFSNNGWSPGVPMPVDPKRGQLAIPSTQTVMGASMRDRNLRRR